MFMYVEDGVRSSLGIFLSTVTVAPASASIVAPSASLAFTSFHGLFVEARLRQYLCPSPPDCRLSPPWEGAGDEITRRGGVAYAPKECI